MLPPCAILGNMVIAIVMGTVIIAPMVVALAVTRDAITAPVVIIADIATSGFVGHYLIFDGAEGQQADKRITTTPPANS